MSGEIIALEGSPELMAAIQRGSEAALRRLYDLEAGRLHGIALRIVRRPDLAADVLQDAFVQVWQNARSFSAERGDVRAWLTGIVRYRALDVVRRHRREILTDDPNLGDRAEEPDIIEQIDAKVAAGTLRVCLDRLEPNQKRSVVLAFIDGLSHAEIASRVAAPLGTVKSWVRRGLVSLRGCLGA